MPNVYWTGATNSSWSTATNWSPAVAPIATDDVFIDGGRNTISLGVTANCASLTTSIAVAFSGTGPMNIKGSLNLAQGCAWTGTGTITLGATAAATINTNGTQLSCPVTINGINGSYTLGGALTMASNRTLTLTNGSLNLAGYSLTCGILSVPGTTAGRTLTFGGGQVYLTGDAATLLNVPSVSAVGQLTFVGAPVFNMTNASAVGTRTFTLSNNQNSGIYGMLDNNLSLNVTAGGGTVSIPAGHLSLWKNLVVTSTATCAVTVVDTLATHYLCVAGDLEFSSGGLVNFGTLTNLRMGTGGITAASLKLSPANSTAGLIFGTNGLSFTLKSDATLLRPESVIFSQTFDLAGYQLTIGAFLYGGSTLAFGATGSLNVTGSTNAANLLSTYLAVMTGTPKITAAGASGLAISQTLQIGAQPNLDLTLKYGSAGTSPSSFDFQTSAGESFWDNTVKSLTLTSWPGETVGATSGVYSVAPSSVSVAATGDVPPVQALAPSADATGTAAAAGTDASAIDAALAAISLVAVAGEAQGSSAIDAALAAISLVAVGGQAQGSSAIDAALAAISLVAVAGEAQGSSAIDAALAAISLVAVGGQAQGGVTGDASTVDAALPAISLAAVGGGAQGSSAINAALSAISLVAVGGQAQGSSLAQGDLAALMLAAAAGQAQGSTSVTCAGEIAGLFLLPPSATAATLLNAVTGRGSLFFGCNF